MIEEDKEFRKEHEDAKKQMKDNQKIIEDLNSKVDRFEQERIRLLDDQAKLAKLYEMGYIDDNGDPLQFRHGDYEDMS